MAKLEFEVTGELEDEIESIFRNSAKKMLRETAEQEKQSKEFMNLRESADYVGVSVNTLKTYFPLGLKHIKIHGKKMIHRETLIDFLKSYER